MADMSQIVAPISRILYVGNFIYGYYLV